MSLKKLTMEVNRTRLLPRIQTTSFLDSPFDCLQLKGDNTNLTGYLQILFIYNLTMILLTFLMHVYIFNVYVLTANED